MTETTLGIAAELWAMAQGPQPMEDAISAMADFLESNALDAMKCRNEMTDQTERELFEAWDQAQYMIDPEHYARTPEGCYKDRSIQCRWECWQYARASAAVAPTALPEGWTSHYLGDLENTLRAWGQAAYATENQFLVGGLLLRALTAIRALRAHAPALKAAPAEAKKPKIDANDLERMAKARPDEKFLKGSGVLKLTGAIRLLEAQLREARAASDGWKPIETAPKDGRSLLLGHFNLCNKWQTLRGGWFSADVIAESWEDHDAPEGWYETSVESDDETTCWWTVPSHWDALPAAPGGAALSAQRCNALDAGAAPTTGESK